MKLKQAGFTLVELLIVVALIGVVASLAAPSFKESINRSKIKTEASQIHGALLFARSESVKNNLPVVICRSAAGLACDGAEWDNGWIIYVDRNQDGVFTAGTDNILRQDLDVSGGITIRASATYVNQIIYRPDGTVNGPSDEGFKVCAAENDNGSRVIFIETTGRPTVELNGGGCPLF